MYTCASVRIEVMGQLAGVGSLLHHVGPGNPIRSPGLAANALSCQATLLPCNTVTEQMNQKPEARSTHTSIHTALKTVGNAVLRGKRKFPLGVDALAFPFQHGIPGDSLGFTVLKSDAKPPGSFGVSDPRCNK